jgi:predicted RNA-binding protein YlqC (UPF0109 family)
MRPSTTDTERTQQLLHALVGMYVTSPQDLQLTARETPGRVEWCLWPGSADTPFIVGGRGSHIRALSYLVGEIGKARDVLYTLTLKEPPRGPAPSWADRPVATEYDHVPARDLIEQLLHAVGTTEFKLNYLTRGIHADGRLRTEFQIWVRSDEDYKHLTVPTGTQDDQTIIAALGTLFRAHANKVGCRIQLQVERVR